MTKARILADLISDNAELADGTISVAEVVGAAPLASPDFTGGIDITGGFTATDGSTITTADNTTQLSLISTDADAGVGPRLDFFRNSANPADADMLGVTRFLGENDAGETIAYAAINARIEDMTDGQEDGRLDLRAMVAGTEGTFMKYHAPDVSGTLEPEVVFNDGSLDMNFRVEGNNHTHAIFLQASSDRVGINESSPDTILHISDFTAPTIRITNTDTTGNVNQTIGEIQFEGSDASTNANGVRANIEAEYGGIGGFARLRFATAGENSTTLLESLNLTSTATVFNDTGANMDFRVESDTNANMLFVDAGNNTVHINGTNASGGDFNIHRDTASTPVMLALHNDDESASSGAGMAFALTRDGGLIFNNMKIEGFKENDWTGTPSTINGTMKFTVPSQESQIDALRLASTAAIFNEGSADRDFRVESNNNTHMLFLDAGGEYINVNTSATYLGGKLNVGGNKTLNNGIPTQQLVVADFTALRAGGGGSIQFNGIYDSSNNLTTAGSIEAYKRNATSGDYGFGLQFKSRTNGATNVERLYMDEANTTFNDVGANVDFRVESDTISNAFTVDGGTGVVSANGSGFTVGNHSGSFNQDGTYISNNSGSFMYMERSGAGNSVQYIHRRTSDGNLIEFHQGGVYEGSISVAGTTVSYNGFCGTHDSSGATVSISTPVGTVLSTIDEEHKADHAKVKVSDSVGDKRVYGVLQQYKETTTSDDTGHTQLEHAVVASVGIASVRVTGACEGGDLLESNGDGTAKVQSDDIVRSKTLGKVTIGNSDTGVKLVSCVMYCG